MTHRELPLQADYPDLVLRTRPNWTAAAFVGLLAGLYFGIATSALLAPAARATIAANLKPGSYLLLDNLPWHYWAGTSVAFTVR